MSALLHATTVATAVSAAMAAGTTFVFSTFVMRALGDLDEPAAVRAMQAIHVHAIHPPFLAVLPATGLLALVLTAAHAVHAGGRLDPWLVGGTALYLAGVIGVTILGNVPLTTGSRASTPAPCPPRPGGATSAPRLRWNHVRTGAAALAAVVFVVAAGR